MAHMLIEHSGSKRKGFTLAHGQVIASHMALGFRYMGLRRLAIGQLEHLCPLHVLVGPQRLKAKAALADDIHCP